MVKSLPKAECKRCRHTWIKRIPNPKVCPLCQSPYWDTERTREKPTEVSVGTKD